MADILLAEDDRDSREITAEILKNCGYTVHLACDGEEALRKYAEVHPSLLLLDVMMPKMSGFAVCAEIRKTDVTSPILFLTAKDEEADKVRGLGLGADGYMDKTVGAAELAARVNAALRRATAASKPDVFPFGDFRINANRLVAIENGSEREVALYPRELSLLRIFSAHRGEVLSREFLLSSLWGCAYLGTTRVLDQHIFSLRKKLGATGDRIATLRGAGYRFS